MSRNACNGENGEKSPAAGDLNWGKSGPLEAGDFGEIGDFGKNRHACNGENGEK